MMDCEIQMCGGWEINGKWGRNVWRRGCLAEGVGCREEFPDLSDPEGTLVQVRQSLRIHDEPQFLLRLELLSIAGTAPRKVIGPYQMRQQSPTQD